MPRADLRIWTLALAMSATGCSTLPSAAPTVSQITKPATPAGIAVIDIVDAPDLGSAARARPAIVPWTIPDAAPFGGEIAVGDTVTVTVFEVGYALFATSGDATRPSEGAPAAAGRALPAMEVGEAGTINIPYVGAVRVVGQSDWVVARDIERRLRGLSQNAQVLVTVRRGPGQSIVVSGDVKTPGRQPLTLAGERLLDVVAQAGGPSNRAADTEITLTRGSQSASARLDDLRIDSAANVRLAPGDRVALTRSVRSVTVLGSARTVSEVPFDGDALTLAETLARSGGPLDDRADATGVFVFRLETGLVNGETREIPVIYRLNLLDPRSYFAAQRFYMRSKDVLLIANARSAQFGKLVQLLNNLVSPAITVDLLTR